MISPAARRGHHQAGLGHLPAARHLRPRWSTTDGQRVEKGGGYLTLTRPWPSMLRGIWGDPERYRETYWSRFEGRYFAGDGAQARRRRLHLVARPGRRRDERVGPPHLDHRGRVRARRPPRRGRGRGGRRQRRHHRPGDHRLRASCGARFEPTDELGEEIRQHVATKIGPTARPKAVIFTPDLPEDPQRQDHAPAAARRGRGPRPRRHHHARRRQRGRGDPAPGRRVAPQRTERVHRRSQPRQLAVARPAGRARRQPSCSTWTACCPTPPAASTSSSGPTATGRRSSRPAATTS